MDFACPYATLNVVLIMVMIRTRLLQAPVFNSLTLEHSLGHFCLFKLAYSKVYIQFAEDLVHFQIRLTLLKNTMNRSKWFSGRIANMAYSFANLKFEIRNSKLNFGFLVQDATLATVSVMDIIWTRLLHVPVRNCPTFEHFLGHQSLCKLRFSKVNIWLILDFASPNATLVQL